MALKKQFPVLNICSPQLGLNPQSILGGEVFDREILLGLAKKGMNVEIILPCDKPHDKNVKNWNISYIHLKHFPAILGNILYLPYVFNTYRKRKFQILRIHQPQFLGIGSLFFKFIYNDVKIIATYHRFGETRFGPLSKFVNQKWDHIICDSENVKSKICEAYKIRRSEVSVVHNGAPKYLKPTIKDPKLAKILKLQGKFVILYMGLFIERKNPAFLINVLSEIHKKYSDVVLLFWGEGPLKKKIKETAITKGTANAIRFIPPKYGPEKNKIHNLADLFVHPSLDEGFALSPLEAMTCSKPIIMNNTHSSSEAVEHGKNGYLCKTNNISDWVEKILELKNNKEKLESMSKYSREKIKKDFSWDKSVNKHIIIFNHL